MTARQGKIALAALVALLTVLLVREAVDSSNWVGLVVTGVGMGVPLGTSWWLLARPRPATTANGAGRQ